MARRFRALEAVAAALLCACSLAGNSAQSDREFLGLAGEVQQVTSRTYYAGGRAGDLVFGSLTVTVFDREGRMVEEKYYDPDNQLTGYRSFKRDRTGRVVEEQMWSASGKLDSRAGYTYDEKGRTQTETYYDPDGSPSGRYSYEYDAQGRLARRLMEAEYSDGSRRSNEAAYSYDAVGRLVEESYREEALGGLALRVTYAYESGRLVYRSDYQRGRWLEFRSFYTYDSAGNVLEELLYQIPESEDSAVYESLTRAESFPQRLLGSRTVHEYRYFQREKP